MSVNWVSVKRKLLKEAGTYRLGDLTFELSRKDIETVCELYEIVKLDPPTIVDCIHYKLEKLDREMDPITWLFDHLSFVEAADISSQLCADPKKKLPSIYDRINCGKQVRKDEINNSKEKVKREVSRELDTIRFDLFTKIPEMKCSCIRFIFDDSDSLFPIKLVGYKLPEDYSYGDSFNLFCLASIGFNIQENLWLVKISINSAVKSLSNLDLVFSFIKDSFVNEISDSGSRGVCNTLNAKHFNVSHLISNHGKLIESRKFKDYYKTTEAFELVISDSSSNYSMGCVYKDGKSWIARNIDSKERKVFCNCLAASDWLCLQAYSEHYLSSRIVYSKRILELAIQ